MVLQADGWGRRMVRGAMRGALRGLALVGLAQLAFAPSAAAGGEDAATSFEWAYAPIVRERCLGCHGEEKPKAGLNLGRRASVLEPTVENEEPVVIPRKPQESRLLQRVADGSMPPEDDGPPLKPKEIAALRAWIEAGADWPADRVLKAMDAAEKGPPMPAKP